MILIQIPHPTNPLEEALDLANREAVYAESAQCPRCGMPSNEGSTQVAFDLYHCIECHIRYQVGGKRENATSQ